MEEGFQYEGYWWLPENPADKISGQLIFVPGEKIALTLRGAFGDNSDKKSLFKPEFIQPRLILGVDSRTGKEITISECQQISGTTVFAYTEFHTTFFIGKTIFVGVHFETEEQLKFKSISVRFSGSEIWAGKKPIVVESLDDFQNEVIRYESPASSTIVVDDTLIRILFLGPANVYSSEQVTISYKTAVEITPKEEKNFSEYLAIIRRLQNFFSLAMGASVYPIEIFGHSQANRKETVKRKDFFPPIDISYLVPSWPKELKAYNRSEILFQLPMIEANLETYIQNWFHKYELLKPAINLYFSVLYNPQNYVEIRFLSLTQAIETYHRRLFGGKYQDDEEYLAGIYHILTKEIPDNINSDFKKSLQMRLRYGNEFSLRKRLREVIRSINNVLDFDFVTLGKKREEFIDKVVDTRNYWTHYSPELINKVEQLGEDRLILITSLQLLLEVNFLRDLGFEEDAIKDLIKKSYRYNLLKYKGA